MQSCLCGGAAKVGGKQLQRPKGRLSTLGAKSGSFQFQSRKEDPKYGGQEDLGSCKMRLSALRLVLERKRALCSFGCLRTFTKWMFAGNLLRRMVRLLELSCFYLDEAGIRAICQERGIKQTE